MSIRLSKTAKFYDGKTGQPQTVSLTLVNKSILLKADTTLIDTWDIRDLTVINRPTPPVPGIYGNKREKDARLYLDNAKEWNVIYARLPKSSKKRLTLPTSWSSFILYAAMSVVSLIFLFLMFPKIIETTAYLIPYKMERSIGKQAVHAMTKGQKTCKEPEAQAILQQAFNKLTQHTSREVEYEIHVIDHPIIPNAFAAPGGYIIVFSSVIERAETPEELMGVLAHEMAHVELYHTTKGIVRTIGMQFAISMIVGGTSIEDLAGFFSQMSYSRENESEADMYGREIMLKANINPKGMRRFFESLNAWENNLFSTGDDDKKHEHTPPPSRKDDEYKLSDFFDEPFWELLSTHPDTDKRIQYLKDMEGNTNYPPAMSHKQWLTLKDICSVKK